MSRFWGYSKRPKNWHKLLREELTDEELDKAVIVAKHKESLSLPPEEKPKMDMSKIEKPKISATVIKPVSASPGSALPVYSASPVLALPVYSASPVTASPVYSASPDSSTSY